MDYFVSYIDSYKNEISTVIRGDNLLDLSLKDIIKIAVLPESINKIKLNGNNIKTLSNLPRQVNEIEALDNKIFKINDLPPIKVLNLSYNNISIIENLPETLNELNLSYNRRLKTLENIPKTIEKLNVSNSNLETIENLSNNINSLNLENNKINTIIIPNKIIYLNISNNNLNCVPKLSSTIKELNISNNRIQRIPSFKKLNKLELLNMSNNMIKKIENLPNSILFLNLSKNSISSIENLPGNLIDLNLASNNISHANVKYPITLVNLDLDSNRISSIFPIPENITDIKLSNNYIKEVSFKGNVLEFDGNKSNLIDFPKFPESITYLNLSETKIRKLVNFDNFTNLVTLKLDYLELKSLFDLPESVQNLSLKGNKIKSLKNIPRQLVNLNVSYNLIQEIPLAVLELRELATFIYIGNPIEARNMLVERWLYTMNNRGNLENNMVYNNGQNVHSSSIQSSFRNSLENLLKDKNLLTLDKVLENIKSTKLLSDNSKDLIKLYCESEYSHSTYLVSYAELLKYVWSRIEKNKNKDELIKIYDEELYDGMGLCFTGRLTRLLNVLSGYYHDIEIQIGDSEQISNIIVKLKNRYEGLDLKKAVKKELEEREFAPGIIKEWINYLD